jgi:branched-chain amino acid transport system ATP-binding protein
MPLLECTDIVKKFGGLTALNKVSFSVERGLIFGVIGPNGAGKTTLLNCITGVYKPDLGTIRFNDEDITGLRPHKICLKGIARTHQIVKPFRTLSVYKNVMIGALFGRYGKKDSKIINKKVEEILEFTGLIDKKDVLASNLTLADQRKLELARALATNPELLLLDEVIAGLNPTEIDGMVNIVRQIRDMGITIIMIEHVMRAVMKTCDRIMVLHHGEKIAIGTPKEISNNIKVIEAYLGKRYM